MDETLTEATAAKPGAPLARALESAVGFAAEGNFDELLAEALRQHEWIDAAVRLDNDDDDRLAEAERIYRKALGLDAGYSLEATTAALAGVLPHAELVRAVRRAGVRLQRRYRLVQEDSLRAASAEPERLSSTHCASIFVTGKGEARKSLMTKAVGAAHPDVDAVLEARATALRRAPRTALQAAVARCDAGARAARRCRHAALRRRQGPAAPRSTSTI